MTCGFAAMVMAVYCGAVVGADEAKWTIPLSAPSVTGPPVPIVNITVQAPEPPKKASEKEPTDHLSSEWALTYATIALALITGALAWYTGSLFRATVAMGADARETAAGQAERMEQSIEQSARAANAMEGVATAMADSLQVSKTALDASQQTVRISQSEILFKHALDALEKAYNLIAQTMNSEGDLDPNKGNLGNWALAARLLVNAQYLRNRLLEEQHRLIYDQVERPRYVELFRWLLKLPESFPADRFHRLDPDLNALGISRSLTNNDYLGEYTLSIIYHFAKGRAMKRDTFPDQPTLGELADGWEYSRGFYGMFEYVDKVRAKTGDGPLQFIQPAPE